MLFPRLTPRGVVFADDTGRPGELEVLHRWAQEFPGFSQHAHFCEKGCHELRAGEMKRDPAKITRLVRAKP
jgi:hypothetical protein